MEIYLLRHGLALDESPRKLAEKGKRTTENIAEMAKNFGVKPDFCLSSPLIRAVETAEIALRVLNPRLALTQTEVLQPDRSPEDVWSEIRVYASENSGLLVGHEPLLSRLAGFLLGAPSLQVDMKKSALIRIDVQNFRISPQGTLKWFIRPGKG